MRIGELRWVLRQSGVLGEAGGEPAPAELADALWLAALRWSGQTPPPAADDLSGDENVLGKVADLDDAENPAQEYHPEQSSLPTVTEPDSARIDGAPPDETPPDSQVYVTLPVRAGSSPGVLVSAAARPQLPETLLLARAMRPLRRRVPSATRRVLDEEGTAELRAEQRLWLPALVPASEPAFELALVLDDSESMALWDEKVREFRLLCERIGAFRDVRVWRLSASGEGSQAKPVLRGFSHTSGTHDERELIDPSGRRLILTVTDGVHPRWQPSGPLRPVLARWALASPLAIVQPFPQRLWDRSPLRLVLEQFRPGWPGSGPTISRSGSGYFGGKGRPESVVVPVLELTPAAMRCWAGIISGTSGLTLLPAATLPRQGMAEEKSPDPIRTDSKPTQSDPARLVREFRASVSPAAYQLAGFLSAAPLTLPVMRLVQESTMPETGPAELAEVFLSGLLRKSDDTSLTADGESGSYVFAAGVRDILQSILTRGEALGVLDHVGGYLVKGRRGGRSFPVLLESQSGQGNILVAAERFPTSFGRISGRLLERIGGPYSEAIRLQEEPTAPIDEERKAGARASRAFAPVGLPTGKLHQPMLFIGLGGTGCDIGVELERRLRAEICGPDGDRFRSRRGREGMLSYQLPSCVQFVYADTNKAGLTRLPNQVVPEPKYIPASALTAHYVTNLVPSMVTYPELATWLRLRVGRAVDGWLPPATPDEPKVILQSGAGNFPTVGRASLMGMFAGGIVPAVRDIREAVSKLAASGEDLIAMGGRLPKSIDVFVAFSVAGGTGAGIFYDYLHIIADTVTRHSSMRVRIFPVVTMPSSFSEIPGDGRVAQLNAGRALLDLFRLVDQQNGADGGSTLRGASDRRPSTEEGDAVIYPDNSRLIMAPGTMQTAFLFSQPAGANREDTHRSIASVILSLAGNDLAPDHDLNDGQDQSFADSFVNDRTDRQISAADGIGGRGVSTALVASLAVPVAEIAEIIASRLLSTAITQLSTSNPYLESPRVSADREEFLTRAGVISVLQRPAVPFVEPSPASGARNIRAALASRRESVRIGIESLKRQLDQTMPALVTRFDPGGGAHQLLATMDVFQLQRVAFGHEASSDQAERGGASGLLSGRLVAPGAPPGLDASPPPLPELRNRFVLPSRWDDPPAIAARRQQDVWYEWQTQVTWARAWGKHAPQWRRPLEQLRRALSALTSALKDFADRGPEDFLRSSAALSHEHGMQPFLFPGGTGGMAQFYEQVMRRLVMRLARDGMVGVNSSEADLVRELAGVGIWAEVYTLSVEQSPGRAISFLRARLRAEIVKFLLESAPEEEPLLPRLRDVLADLAGQHGTREPGLPRDHAGDFTRELAKLLPAGLTPRRNGLLKVLITYPADERSDVIERFLERSIGLSAGQRIIREFRVVNANAITVMLLCTGMGITDVPESRETLRLWAGALSQPRRSDGLRWRQRTGYDFAYPVTTEANRVVILHRLLCALWNARGTVTGLETSPQKVDFTLVNGDRVTLQLPPSERASSWASLLHAYEACALDDDDLRRASCRQLMRELPDGLGSRPRQPSNLYLTICHMAEAQIEVLDNTLAAMSAGERSRAAQMRKFWTTTIPTALDLDFTGLEAPVARNLRELEFMTRA